MTYQTRMGATCGTFLRNFGEGRGELTLFFDKDTSEETCFHFEEYVHTHLLRHALPESVQPSRIFTCPNCGEALTNSQVMNRRKLGFNMMRCGVCDTEISLFDRKELLTATYRSRILEIDNEVDKQREQGAIASVRQGLQNTVVDAVKLRKAMLTAYNLTEIETLCADMQVNYDNLGGSTLKLKNIYIIEYCQRRRIYETLIHKVLSERPTLMNELV